MSLTLARGVGNYGLMWEGTCYFQGASFLAPRAYLILIPLPLPLHPNPNSASFPKIRAHTRISASKAAPLCPSVPSVGWSSCLRLGTGGKGDDPVATGVNRRR